jgi:hypothetical protein
VGFDIGEEIMPQETDREQDYHAEAARLAQLPRDVQRAILDLHRSVAADPKVSRGNRREARERAEALGRLLKVRPKKRDA